MIARIAVLGMLVFTVTARGATYYVSPEGDDAAPGTADRPWATVQHAADTAVAGDTVVIGEGVYRETVLVRNSGEPDRPITFRGEPARAAVIDGTGRRDFYGVFEVRGRSHIVIEGLTVTGGPRYTCGIVAIESRHVTIRNCRTYNTAGTGIMVWESSDVVVDGNEVERACQRGGEESVTVKYGSDRVQVSNNHIHNTRHEGIDVKEGSRNVRVFGNYLHHVERQGLYADAWNRETYNIHFFNNIVHSSGFGMGACAETGGLLRDVRFYNNIIYNCAGPGMFVADWGPRGYENPSDGVAFVNNIIHNCGTRWGGALLVENRDAKNILIRNNIFSRSGPPHVIVRRPPISITISHNLFFGEGEPVGEAAVVGDPLFVDPEAGDFRLQEGSPALGAGSLDVPEDVDPDLLPRTEDAAVSIGADAAAIAEVIAVPEDEGDR